MYLLFIWDSTYGFDGGEIHNERQGGVGPEIETFLGPEMATSVASANLAQKNDPVHKYVNTPSNIFIW